MAPHGRFVIFTDEHVPLFKGWAVLIVGGHELARQVLPAFLALAALTVALVALR